MSGKIYTRMRARQGDANVRKLWREHGERFERVEREQTVHHAAKPRPEVWGYLRSLFSAPHGWGQ